MHNYEDFYESLSPSEKSEIELSLKQLDEGKRIPFEETLRKISE